MMMSHSKNTWLAKTLLGGVCLGLFLATTSCLAYDVVRVEEHWELSVGGPDEGRCAPQVSMVMSPTGDLNGNYFIFSLNHWSAPEFAEGGLEVQRWKGDGVVSSHRSSNHSPLRVDGEKVSWVQAIEISESQLRFSIESGQSQTWGTFGGEGLLKSSYATELTRLNDYKPNISLSGSGIGYAGNRVSSLTLMKLVWWSAAGDRYEMIAPIDIDSDIDP